MGGASSFPKLRGAASAAGGRRPRPGPPPAAPEKTPTAALPRRILRGGAPRAFGRVPRRARLRRGATRLAGCARISLACAGRRHEQVRPRTRATGSILARGIGGGELGIGSDDRAGRRGDVLLRRVRNAPRARRDRTPRSQGRRTRLRNRGGRARRARTYPHAETSTMVLLRGGLRDRRAFVAGRGRAPGNRRIVPAPAPSRRRGRERRARSEPPDLGRPRAPRTPCDSEDERARVRSAARTTPRRRTRRR